MDLIADAWRDWFERFDGKLTGEVVPYHFTFEGSFEMNGSLQFMVRGMKQLRSTQGGIPTQGRYHHSLSINLSTTHTVLPALKILKSTFFNRLRLLNYSAVIHKEGMLIGLKKSSQSIRDFVVHTKLPSSIRSVTCDKELRYVGYNLPEKPEDIERLFDFVVAIA